MTWTNIGPCMQGINIGTHRWCRLMTHKWNKFSCVYCHFHLPSLIKTHFHFYSTIFAIRIIKIMLDEFKKISIHQHTPIRDKYQTQTDKTKAKQYQNCPGNLWKLLLYDLSFSKKCISLIFSQRFQASQLFACQKQVALLSFGELIINDNNVKDPKCHKFA